jgi:hypothetical protein
MASTLSFAATRELTTQEFYKEIGNSIDNGKGTGAAEGRLDFFGDDCLIAISVQHDTKNVVVTVGTAKKDFSLYFSPTSKITMTTDALGDKTYTSSDGAQVIVHRTQLNPVISAGNGYTMLTCLSGQEI